MDQVAWQWAGIGTLVGLFAYDSYKGRKEAQELEKAIDRLADKLGIYVHQSDAVWDEMVALAFVAGIKRVPGKAAESPKWEKMPGATGVTAGAQDVPAPGSQSGDGHE